MKKYRYLIKNRIRQFIFYKHRNYLRILLAFSVILMVVCSDWSNIKEAIHTIILNSCIGIVASTIVLLYTDWKSEEKDHREKLLSDIEQFFIETKIVAMKIDSKLYPFESVALDYIKLTQLQASITERYNELKTMVKPTPAFGDSEISIVKDIQDRILEMAKEDSNQEYKQQTIEMIRDSIAVMERQTRLCKMRIQHETKLI